MALNQTLSPESISKEESSTNFVQICEIIIGCFGIFGNLTSVLVLGRRSVRNQTNWLIVNQAVVDALVSFFLVAAVSTQIAGVSPKNMDRVSGEIFCKFWGSLSIVFGGFAISTFNLTAISIERYIAVVHPIWYLSHFKQRAMVILITLAWCLAPVLQIVTVSTQYGVSQEGECYYYPKYSQILVALFFWEYFMPICVMTFSFFSIIVKFRELNKIAIARTREIQNTLPIQGPSAPEEVSVNREVVASRPAVKTLHVPGEMAASTIRPGSSTSSREPNRPHDQRNPIQDNAVGRILREVVASRPAVKTLHVPGEMAASSTIRPGSSASSREPNRPHDQRNPIQDNAVGRIQRRNTTKVLFSVYIIFLICWSPNQWAFLQFNLGGYLDFKSTFYRLTVVMGILNTCINPFIYALRLKIYQRELKSMIQSFYCH
ncbi:dopamine D2-like receptor [Lytechinus variegatus]|uniref:dopamine D2-like receptor n=1 Tax=Lytechinus variegatus TaxID=7654 RepID=UPI001BB1F272|nr:dopamine D2-like receptor [Lytechinus variegatus]